MRTWWLGLALSLGLSATAGAQDVVRLGQTSVERPPVLAQGESQPVTIDGRQGWIRTLMRNGPSTERIDLLLLAEGFKANRADRFEEDCERILTIFTEKEPFNGYRHLFNVHALFLPSADNGIGRGRSKDTVFKAYFVDRSGPGTQIDADTLGIQRMAYEAIPEDVDIDLFHMVCNDSRHGGSAISNLSSTTRVSEADRLKHGNGIERTTAHELGHTLGNLGDEYEGDWDEEQVRALLATYPQPNIASVELPQGDLPWRDWPEETRAQVPWGAWIHPTNVPKRSYRGCSLYRGALYSKRDAYRPAPTCCMRDRRQPFCSPCKEALVLRMHAIVNPVRYRFDREGDVLVLGVAVPIPSPGVRWSVSDSAPAELKALVDEAIGLELRIPTSLVPDGAEVVLETWDASHWLRSSESTQRATTFVIEPATLAKPNLVDRLETP